MFESSLSVEVVGNWHSECRCDYAHDIITVLLCVKQIVCFRKFLPILSCLIAIGLLPGSACFHSHHGCHSHSISRNNLENTCTYDEAYTNSRIVLLFYISNPSKLLTLFCIEIEKENPATSCKGTCFITVTTSRYTNQDVPTDPSSLSNLSSGPFYVKSWLPHMRCTNMAAWFHRHLLNINMRAALRPPRDQFDATAYSSDL